MKFLECDWSLSDEDARAQGRITPSQEWAILRILEERDGSRGAILADDMGQGKTVMGTEVALRGDFKRVLFIGLPNTHEQWAERIVAQSDGEVQPRIMNGTAEGKENLRRFRDGEPGYYIAGSHYLTAQDFESKPLYWSESRGETLARGDDTTPLFRVVRKTGEVELRDRKEGVIGPAQEPRRKTKSVHLAYFRARLKKHPLDLIVFDEMHLIANKHAQGRRTIVSLTGEDTFRLGMSGTWFLNSPDNMFSGARWVWPGINPATGRMYVESNHKAWREQWLTKEPVLNKDGWPVERNGRAVEKVVGEREEGAFVASLPCYIRRESAIPLPPAEVIYVEPLPAQKRQIEDLQRDLLTWVWAWDGTEEPLVVDMPPELHTRLRQAALAELSLDEAGNIFMADGAESASLAPLHALLTKAWPGQQVGIITDSKVYAKFVERRMQAAGVRAKAWHGDLTKKQRAALKQEFIDGDVQYLIATIQAFGVGIDGLQRVCDKVIWLSELEGSPAVNAQAIRRYLRPGQLLRGRDAEGNPTSEFVHVKIVPKGTVHETGMQNLIHQAWVMARSLTAPAVA